MAPQLPITLAPGVVRLKALCRGALLLSCVSQILCCAPQSSLVPRGPHRPAAEEEPEFVKEPPPPAKVEVVPLRRNERCSYLDGHYAPRGQDWVWTRGRWVLLRKRCYYAPPQTTYEKVRGGNALVFRKGAWHPRNAGDAPCPEPQPCPDPFVTKAEP